MTHPLSETGLIDASDLYFLSAGREDIKFLDATYMVPGGRTTPYDAYLERHIPGAQFFDIDDIADPESALPHTLPSADLFALKIAALGINNTDHVVVYDQSGAYMASSRAWWMFRVFGHNHVYVLHGGMGAWVTGGYPIESGEAAHPTPTVFKTSFQKDLYLDRHAVLNNLSAPTYLLVDARSPDRFQGLAPEPRPNMRSGHIPGSLNLPFSTVLSRTGGQMKSPDDITVLLKSHNIDVEKMPLATTCGSGVTACTVALALYTLGIKRVPVYDGSWSEWGQIGINTPVEQ